MSVIGFRCFIDSFSYVVLGGTQQNPSLIAHEKIPFPMDISWGEKMSWLRRQIIEVLGIHNISLASLKVIEPSARTRRIERAHAEGIIIEAVFSTLNQECECRIKSQIRRDIEGFTEAARYLNRALSSRGLNELNNATYQDAAFVALAELSGQD